MKIDDIFDNADDITANKIAGNYPVLNEKDKERLFAMSKRKYNITLHFLYINLLNLNIII